MPIHAADKKGILPFGATPPFSKANNVPRPRKTFQFASKHGTAQDTFRPRSPHPGHFAAGSLPQPTPVAEALPSARFLAGRRRRLRQAAPPPLGSVRGEDTGRGGRGYLRRGRRGNVLRRTGNYSNLNWFPTPCNTIFYKTVLRRALLRRCGSDLGRGLGRGAEGGFVLGGALRTRGVLQSAFRQGIKNCYRSFVGKMFA